MVSVPKAAFAFCRYGITLLIWVSLLFRLESLFIVVFLLLLASAILGVKRAPMIFLYEHTVQKIFPSKDQILNEHSMRFAHILGSAVSFICLLLLFLTPGSAGWMVIFLFAILKSISALGFCPAAKLYECSTKNGCCPFLKKHD